MGTDLDITGDGTGNDRSNSLDRQGLSGNTHGSTLSDGVLPTNVGAVGLDRKMRRIRRGMDACISRRAWGGGALLHQRHAHGDGMRIRTGRTGFGSIVRPAEPAGIGIVYLIPNIVGARQIARQPERDALQDITRYTGGRALRNPGAPTTELRKRTILQRTGNKLIIDRKGERRDAAVLL